MARDFVVSVREDTERGQAWAAMLGTTRVHVRSPVPSWVNLPELGASPVFFLDLETLTKEQLDRLVEHLARKFDLTLGEVTAQIGEAGVPILAEDCSVTVYNPQRWF